GFAEHGLNANIVESNEVSTGSDSDRVRRLDDDDLLRWCPARNETPSMQGRNSNMLKVNVITTGGTIEKVYSEQSSTVENLDNQIDRYLGPLRLPDRTFPLIPPMNKHNL